MVALPAMRCLSLASTVRARQSGRLTVPTLTKGQRHMLTRSVAALAVCLVLSASLQGGIIVEGITYVNLAPTLPSGANDSVMSAYDAQGRLWTSDGKTLYRSDAGAWVESINLYGTQSVVTTSCAWSQSSDLLYFNNWWDGDVRTRDGAGNLATLAHLGGTIRQMRWGPDGKLYVGSQTNENLGGDVYRLSPDGSVVELVGHLEQGVESFDFLPDGNLVAPHFDGTGIDKLNVTTGEVTPLYTYVRDETAPWVFESIAVTPGGNILIGENSGMRDGIDDHNRSKLWRVTVATGVKELIGFDIDLSIPASLTIAGDGTLIYSGYGSTHALTITGNLDGPLIPLLQTPEPSTVALAAIAAAGLVFHHRRRRI